MVDKRNIAFIHTLIKPKQMNTNNIKTKIAQLIKEINSFEANLNDDDNKIPDIELDLLLSHIRELYAQILQIKNTENTKTNMEETPLPDPPVDGQTDEEADSVDLNEKFSEEQEVLAQRLQNNPIDDLRSAIGVNDKALYVQELFNGDLSGYDDAVRFLNDCTELQQAEDFINELKVKHDWSEKQELAEGFINLVKRKIETV